MMGFGPIAPEPDEPVFHHQWERRALALTLAAAACGLWNIDISRHARETLPPAVYLSMSYYESGLPGSEAPAWRGMVAAEELQQGKALAPARSMERRLTHADVARVLANGSPYDRPPRAPPGMRPAKRRARA